MANDRQIHMKVLLVEETVISDLPKTSYCGFAKFLKSEDCPGKGAAACPAHKPQANAPAGIFSLLSFLDQHQGSKCPRPVLCFVRANQILHRIHQATSL